MALELLPQGRYDSAGSRQGMAIFACLDPGLQAVGMRWRWILKAHCAGFADSAVQF
jgi:hypothetical protein